MSLRRSRSRSARLKPLGLTLGLPALLLVSLVPLADAARAQSPAAAPALLTNDSASAQAVASGSPVEVTALTTETTRVMAQPDGTFELAASRAPVRARRGTGWAPIDTTLVVNADGTYSPGLTATPVRFSGGGTGPMLRVGAAGAEVDLTWPGNLPAPTVAGDTATYANVLADTDLALVARGDGYSEALVVKTPAAAQYLIAHPVTLSANGIGVDLDRAPDGSLAATDGDGQMVLAGPPPTLWDSSNVPTGPAVRPGTHQSGNAKVRALGMVLSDPASPSSTITLTVPSAVASDPSTTYPLYVDPAMSSGKTHFLTVESGGYDYYDSSTELMRVGYCGWAGCTSSNGNARSYFSVNTTALTGQATTAHVYSADVYADQVWNATSAAEPVNLTKSGAFSSSTNYPGPYSTTLQTISSACGANGANTCNLDFNNSAVDAYLQDAANGDWTSTSFALSAPAENNANYWKKFASNPTITVKYDFPPSTPTGLDVASKVACSGKPVYTRDTTPTVYAQANDNNPSPLNVGLDYEIWTSPAGSAVVRKNSTPVSTPQNTRTSWTTNSSNTNNSTAMNEGPYALRVRAESMSTDTAHQFSGYSGWYYFTVDGTGPATSALAIKSFTYPQDYWGSAPSTPGTFTFTGPTDVAAFTYSIDSAGSEPLPADTTCTYTTATGSSGMTPASGGTASLKVSSTLTSGYHHLYVKAFDNAHNVSGEISYSFYVSPTFSAAGANYLEAEKLAPVTQKPSQLGYSYTEGASGIWSGSYQSHLVANTQGASFTYPLNPAASGYYAAGVRLTTSNHYANLKFQIDGKDVLDKAGQPITQDTNSTSTGSVYVPLGGVRLDVGAGITHTLTMVMVSTSGSNYTYNGSYGTEGVSITNYADNGYSAGLDSITLAPLSGVSFANLQDAFNNKGIAVDNSSAADFDLTANAYSLSKAALTSAGISPGKPYTIGNVTFTIPTANPSGNDNVVATGQTISMGTPGSYPIPGSFASPGYVAVLVASTCGNLVQTQSKNLTMELGETGSSTSVMSDWNISALPDWLASADTTQTYVTTDHIDVGTTPKTRPATLYLLQAPIPQDYGGWELRSVTLPRVGTDFTQTCTATNSALHILAMTTSSGS